MRQIDNMTPGEIETLRLKGMLGEPLSEAEREHRQRMIDHAKRKEKEDYYPDPDELNEGYYSSRDEGRNDDGTGESYAERNT